MGIDTTNKPCESIRHSQARLQGTQTLFGSEDRASSARRVTDRKPHGDLDNNASMAISHLTQVCRSDD